MSRTPVREALSRLAAEGIVELRPNRGARLVELSRKDIDEIFDMRALLEPYAAACAARVMGPEGRRRLCSLQDDMDALEGHEPDVMEVRAKLNNAFHTAIIEMTGSQLISAVLSTASREPLLHRMSATVLTKDQENRLAREHRDVAAAIVAGDARLAEASMLCHIETARAIYLETFDRSHRFLG